MKSEELISRFKQTKEEESDKIELDNLDWARLVYDDNGKVVVENEHGTQFPVSDLSEKEIEIFMLTYKSN